MSIAYKNLIKDGVVVVPVFTDRKERESINDEFRCTLSTFPEFINPTADTVFTAEYFGAMSHPSSFHNPFVRKIRRSIMKDAVRVFQHSSKKLEQLIDRMVVRKKGTKCASEQWHRDVSPSKLEGDTVYGGWVNLDIDNEQGFSCVVGTHFKTGKETKETGFCKFTDDEKQEFKDKKTIVKVPAGCMIIFDQSIVHEILPRTSPIESYRLYTGWRLTEGNLPLHGYDELRDAIKHQGLVRLPGGEIPFMYAKNTIRFRREVAQKFSSTIKKICREDDGLVHRNMRSLKEYEFPMFEKYRREDLELLFPFKWVIDDKGMIVRVNK